MVIAMIEKQSEIGQDAQLSILLHHKRQKEIERAFDRVKMGVVPAIKRTKADKWFRKQWYRSMMRDRKRPPSFLIHESPTRDYNECDMRSSFVQRYRKETRFY